MKKFSWFAVPFLLVACTSETVVTKPAGSSTEKTDPTTPSTDKASVSAACTEYFACCDELAAKQPSLGATCDQTRNAFDDAESKGADTASLDTSCKNGVSAFQQAGYCK